MKRLVLLSTLVAFGLSGCDRFRSQIPMGNTFTRASDGAKECDRVFKLPITIEEEVAVGDAAAVPLVQRAGGLFLDPAGAEPSQSQLHTYVNRVGKNLAAQSARPELAWSFGVIDSDGVNAFAAPGGRVFVTRGLLKTMTSEAELAGVLAHEIAHVVNQHGIKAYRHVKKNACSKAVIGGVADSVISSAKANISASMSEILKPEAAGFVDMNLNQHHALLRTLGSDLAEQIATVGYDKQDEFIADIDGIHLAMAAGYNPNPFIDLLGKLPTGKGGVNHHPPAAERQARANKWVATVTRASDDPKKFPGPFSGLDVSTLATVPLKDQLAAAK